MQPIKILEDWLNRYAKEDRYLFSLQDMIPLFPDLSINALRTLLCRASKKKLLERVCRNLYAFKPQLSRGRLLFHAAAYLRSNEFNYISLETVLSEAGIISQIPINAITIMTSGRSNIISCGKFGTIEFIHTQRLPHTLNKHLQYDADCRMWRADISLALRDIKRVRRNIDLINEDIIQ